MRTHACWALIGSNNFTQPTRLGYSFLAISKMYLGRDRTGAELSLVGANLKPLVFIAPPRLRVETILNNRWGKIQFKYGKTNSLLLSWGMNEKRLCSFYPFDGWMVQGNTMSNMSNIHCSYNQFDPSIWGNPGVPLNFDCSASLFRCASISRLYPCQ